ncbi:MAG: hypothetical protein Q4C91_01110 [Eubacteriales bacterium]|nr:hypothetical protein [Eubacteriales bacterium]
MKGKHVWKKLAACLLVIAMVTAMAFPVSAATRYSKSWGKTISAGQSYHILNTNISGNKISNYVIEITPKTGSTYDVVYALYDAKGNPRQYGNKNATAKKTISNARATYIKSSSAANSGMLACIKVTKGSVNLRLAVTTTNRNAALSLRRQASSHQPLKGVAVKKGQRVCFESRSSNIPAISLVMGAQKGAAAQRPLGAKYENYTFSSKLQYRMYQNGVLQKSKSLNKSYDTKLGSYGYIQVMLSSRGSGYIVTKSGTVNYYYPSDYLNIAVYRK